MEVRYMKAIRVIQGKVLVEPVVQATALGNGLQINQETQSRKDVATGLVIDGKYKDSMVYFPLYAASPIVYQGKSYLIIDEQDILAMEYDTDDTANS
jgi:co-chaperonin GroES (HSP10)